MKSNLHKKQILFMKCNSNVIMATMTMFIWVITPDIRFCSILKQPKTYIFCYHDR